MYVLVDGFIDSIVRCQICVESTRQYPTELCDVRAGQQISKSGQRGARVFPRA